MVIKMPHKSGFDVTLLPALLYSFIQWDIHYDYRWSLPLCRVLILMDSFWSSNSFEPFSILNRINGSVVQWNDIFLEKLSTSGSNQNDRMTFRWLIWDLSSWNPWFLPLRTLEWDIRQSHPRMNGDFHYSITESWWWSIIDWPLMGSTSCSCFRRMDAVLWWQIDLIHQIHRFHQSISQALGRSRKV